MAELIPISEMTELKSAAQAKAVADEALKIHEKQQIAAAINSAANSGEHSIIYQHPISDEVKAILEGQGYKVTRKPHSANPDFLYKIEGF